MQQLGLRSDSSAPAAPTVAATLSRAGRTIGVGLLACPFIFLLLIFAYNLITIGLSWSGWQATLAMITVLLFGYQFFGGLLRLGQILLSLLATRRNTLSRRLSSRFTLVDSPKIQPVSVIIWAQNHGENLAATLKSLLSLNYPDYEIIVVNDGSNDNTMEVLELEFGLQPLNRVFRRSLATGPISATYTSPRHPILTVVEKPRAGRADSLNIGLNLAKAPLICVIEPGYLLARDALLLLAKPFIEQPALTVISAGLGENEADANDSASYLDNIQLVERKRLFHSSLIERDNFCLISLTNNAARLLRKADLIDAGGFLDFKADLELCLRLQDLLLSRNRAYRVSFIPDILCWRHNPEFERSVSQSHQEWQAATLHGVARNIQMFRQPKLIAAMLVLIFDLLSPIVELLGFLLVLLALVCGAIALPTAFLYLGLIVSFALMESLGGIIADELSLRYRHTLSEIITLIVASFWEGSLYRPVTHLWRAQGVVSSLIKSDKQ